MNTNHRLPWSVPPSPRRSMRRDEEARQPKSRCASIIELPDRSRVRVSRSPSSDPHYDPYISSSNHRHSRGSPRYGSPSPQRSPSPDTRSQRRWSPPRHDRWWQKNGRVPGLEGDFSDDDEELKGLPYIERQRLICQKPRKQLKDCIWRVTPSPPRGQDEPFDEPDAFHDPSSDEEEKKEKQHDRKKANDRADHRRCRGSSRSEDSDYSDSASPSDDSNSESPRSRKSSRRRT